MLRDAETNSIAETKAVEEKIPSGRRNDATRTMINKKKMLHAMGVGSGEVTIS
jgi:hypothetical protein